MEDSERQRMNKNALCPGIGDYLIAQARNNHWSNYRLHSACLRLPAPEYYANRPSFFGSIHTHLDHIVFVDWLYLERFTVSRQKIWNSLIYKLRETLDYIA